MAGLSYCDTVFFLGYSDLRNLHSFPTRRSSDLSGVNRGTFGPYVTGDRLRVSVESGVVKYYRNGDRKSTRLNSSHTVMSYAVFCLTKRTVVRDVVISGSLEPVAVGTPQLSVGSG